jgi:hypothetical protein
MRLAEAGENRMSLAKTLSLLDKFGPTLRLWVTMRCWLA